jgi:hypothetical protein
MLDGQVIRLPCSQRQRRQCKPQSGDDGENRPKNCATYAFRESIRHRGNALVLLDAPILSEDLRPRHTDFSEYSPKAKIADAYFTVCNLALMFFVLNKPKITLKCQNARNLRKCATYILSLVRESMNASRQDKLMQMRAMVAAHPPLASSTGQKKPRRPKGSAGQSIQGGFTSGR